LGSNKGARANRRHLWSGAPDCPVHHRTCPVHQRTPNSNSSPSGNSRGNSAIIHRTVRCTPDCPVHHRTCPVHQRTPNSNSSPSGNSRGNSAIIHRNFRCSKEERPPELASLRNSFQLLRYNSPDMSGVHRTVRCNSGATATLGANGYLRCI
jgi:hypothetical protein